MSWLRGLFQKRAAPGLVGDTMAWLPLYAPESPVTEEDAQQYWRGIFYRCVMLRASAIAEAMAGARVERFVRQGHYEMVEPTHPWVQLLLRPTPRKSATMLWHWVALVRDLVGSCYLVAERDGLGRVKALWPLEPAWGTITPVFSEAGEIVRYEYMRHDGKRIRFDADAIVDLSVRDPLNSRRAVSLLDRVFSEIKSDSLQHTLRAAILERGGLSPFYVYTDRLIGEEQAELMRQRLKMKFRGMSGVGEFPVLSKAEIRTVGLSGRDLEYADSVLATARLIMMVAGVPEGLLTGSANRANAEAARAVFMQNTVMPEATLLAQQLTVQLEEAFGAKAGMLRVRPLDLVPVDAETRSRIRQVEVMIGLKSPNEIRREDGLEPYEGGDVHYVAANLIPITENAPLLEQQPTRQLRLERRLLELDIDRLTREADAFYEGLLDDLFRELEEAMQREEEKVSVDAKEEGDRVALVLALAAASLSEWFDAFRRLQAGQLERFLNELARRYAEQMGVDPTSVRTEAAMRNLLRLADFHTETLRRDVSEIVQKAVGERWSRDVLREALKEKFSTLKEGRAKVWAQTVATASVNAASYSAFEAAGVSAVQWRAVMDDRTRHAHRQANGQVRPLGIPFEVGGQLLMFPGDTSLGATADNIANCRCWLEPAQTNGTG